MFRRIGNACILATFGMLTALGFPSKNERVITGLPVLDSATLCPSSRIDALLGQGMTNNLFIITDGQAGAKFTGESPGYQGNIIVDGIQASELTAGFVPYAGVITTNDNNVGQWQTIVNNNSTQASTNLLQTTEVATKTSNVESAILAIEALTVTPGFDGVSAASLDGLNTTNGIAETFVINVKTGFSINGTKIRITGDRGDLFILRWDTDADFTNGLNGQVKFQSGGAIVPQGALTPGNFIHIAGDLSSSGGGTVPLPPYPQGPRFDNGSGALIANGTDWPSGGFFTGYWLTTGIPSIANGKASGIRYGPTSNLDRSIFVGGWYTITTKFEQTSGSGGVNYVCQDIGVTAAPVSISGRVMDANGNGIARARVSLLDAKTGQSYVVNTSTFGYYTFQDLTSEDLYFVSVTAKGYSFSPRSITLLDDEANFDFTAQPPASASTVKQSSVTLAPSKKRP